MRRGEWPQNMKTHAPEAPLSANSSAKAGGGTAPHHRLATIRTDHCPKLADRAHHLGQRLGNLFHLVFIPPLDHHANQGLGTRWPQQHTA
jgi:hypothetical protein